MQKAVIITGGKQYIVQKGDQLKVELIGQDKNLSFEPLMIFDEKNTSVGTPAIANAKVVAKVIERNVKSAKVKVGKFQAKKRVKTLRGHRQQYSLIEITGISVK